MPKYDEVYPNCDEPDKDGLKHCKPEFIKGGKKFVGAQGAEIVIQMEPSGPGRVVKTIGYNTTQIEATLNHLEKNKRRR